MAASILPVPATQAENLECIGSSETTDRLEGRLIAIGNLLGNGELESAFLNLGLALDTLMKAPALFIENFSCCIGFLNCLQAKLIEAGRYEEFYSWLLSDCLQRLIQHFKEQHFPGQALAYFEYLTDGAYLFSQIEHLSIQLVYLRYAHTIAHTYAFKKEEIQTLANIGIIYLKMGDAADEEDSYRLGYNSACHYFNIAHELAKDEKDELSELKKNLADVEKSYLARFVPEFKKTCERVDQILRDENTSLNDLMRITQTAELIYKYGDAKKQAVSIYTAATRFAWNKELPNAGTIDDRQLAISRNKSARELYFWETNREILIGLRRLTEYLFSRFVEGREPPFFPTIPTEFLPIVLSELHAAGLITSISDLEFNDNSISIHTLQQLHGNLITAFISSLFNQAIDFMGPLPSNCKYCLVGLGSLARGEMGVYSDLDAVILIEEESEANSNFFKRVAEFFELLIINLGETRYFVGDEPYLKDGFCLDPTALSPVRTIETPEQMVARQSKELHSLKVIREMDPITNALRVPCLIAGDGTLYEQYTEGLFSFFQGKISRLSSAEQRQYVDRLNLKNDDYALIPRITSNTNKMDEISFQMREISGALRADDPPALEKNLLYLIALSENTTFMESVASEHPFSENIPYVILSNLSEVMNDRLYIGLPPRLKLLIAKVFNSYTFFLHLFHESKGLKLAETAKEALIEAAQVQINAFTSDQADANKENRHRYDVEIQAYYEAGRENLRNISGTSSFTKDFFRNLLGVAVNRDFAVVKTLLSHIYEERKSTWSVDCLIVQNLKLQALHSQEGVLELLDYLEGTNPNWRVAILVVDSLLEIALHADRSELKALAFFGTRIQGKEYKGLTTYLHFNMFWFTNNWRIRNKAFRALVYLTLHSDVPRIRERATHLVLEFNGLKIRGDGVYEPRAEALGAKLLSLLTFPTDILERKSIDVKQDLYRPVTLAIDALAAYHNLEVYETTARSQILEEADCLHPDFASLFRRALELACRQRIRVQIHSGEEFEVIQLDLKTPGASQLTLSYEDYSLLRELQFLLFRPLSEMDFTSGTVGSIPNSAKIAYAEYWLHAFCPERSYELLGGRSLELFKGTGNIPPALIADVFLQLGKFETAARYFHFKMENDIIHVSPYDQVLATHNALLAQIEGVDLAPLNRLAGLLHYFAFHITTLIPPSPPDLPSLILSEAPSEAEIEEHTANTRLTQKLLYRYLAKLEAFLPSERMKKATWEFRETTPLDDFPLSTSELYQNLCPLELGDLSSTDLFYADIIPLLSEAAAAYKELPLEPQQLIFGYIYDHIPEEMRHRFFSELTAQGLSLSLLNTLRNFPRPNGYRPMALNEKISWRSLSKSIASPDFLDETLQIEGIETPKNNLNPAVSEWIVQLARGSQTCSKPYSGRHKVEAKDGVFYKLNPEFAGKQYAVGLLSKLITGRGCPPHDLLKISNENGMVPVMASAEIKGTNLQDVLDDTPDVLERLDKKQFSELAIMTMLTDPEDAKADNFVVQAIDSDGPVTLVDIDPDRVFVTPFKKGWTSDAIQVKNIIYCMPFMLQPIDPQFRKEFLALNPIALLQQWLKALTSYNQRCIELFGEKEINRLLQAKKICEIPFFLKPTERSANGEIRVKGLLLTLFEKFKLIQELLKADPTTAPIALLFKIEPQLAKLYYAELTISDKPVLQRFNDLTATEYKRARGSTLSITSTRLNPAYKKYSDYVRHGWTLDAARRDLVSIVSSRGSIQLVVQNLIAGDGEILHSLNQPAINNLILKQLDFRTLTEKEQAVVLKTITGLTFTRLHLANCSVLKASSTFSSSTLENLLKTSPNLLFLDLGKANGPQDLSFLSARCPHLKKLNVRGIESLKSLGTPSKPLVFPSLRSLDLSHCPNLQEIHIDAPSLEVLKVKGSSFPPTFRITAPKIRQLAIDDHECLADFLSICSPTRIHYKNAKIERIPPFDLSVLSGLRSIICEDFYMRFADQDINKTPEEIIAIVKRLKWEATNVGFKVENQIVYAKLLIKTYVSDDTVSTLAINNPDLQSVNFKACWDLTNAAVKALATRCPSLQSVNFKLCFNLTDISLKALATHCRHLQSVDFSKCPNLTDAAVEALAMHCRNLQSVDFSWCPNLTDSAVEALATRCPILQSVDFSKCPNLTDISLKALATHCRNLQSVDFSGCKNLTAVMVKTLATVRPNSRSVDFSRCKEITDAMVEILATRCPSLQSVDFSGCDNLTNAAVETLATRCRNLQSVTFSGCSNLTDAAMEALATHCRNLQSVDFSGSFNLTDAMVETLATHCPNLQSVDFSECGNLTDVAIKALATRCPSLQSVDFSGCDNLTDVAVEALATHCPNLQSVKFKQSMFSWSFNLTDVAVGALATHCRNLRSVNFSGCENLTDVAVEALATHCRHLQSVDFSWCKNLTDSAVEALATRCPSLQSVNFKGCFNLTNAAAKALAMHCRNLQSADFSGCRKLTDSAVEALATRRYHLQSVSFSGCKKLTDAALEALATRCRNLQSVGFSGSKKLISISELFAPSEVHGLSGPPPSRFSFPGRSNLTDATEKALATVRPNSRSVDFSGSKKLTDAMVETLATRCRNLQSVNFSGCKNLTDAGVEALATHCRHLQSVDFPKCENLTDVGMEALAKNCPKLRSVNFSGCKNLTDASLEALAKNCPKLRSVDFSWCYDNFTDAAVEALATHCRHLQSVDFSWCKNLTDASLIALATHCRNLQSVDFSMCHSFTDASLEALAKNCPKLRSVDFSWCYDNFTDAALEALAVGCRNLQSVTFRECYNFTDASLIALATHCPNLQSVNFRGCRNFTDASVIALAAGCPSLQSVNCRWNENFTDAALKALAAGCPTLRSVDFRGCKNFTDTAWKVLATNCPMFRKIFERVV